ncbi:MAG: pyruvate formate lyase family protein [Armatimonadota bacterium]
MQISSCTYKPSPRIAKLRERAVARDPELFFGGRRFYYYLQGWMAAEGQPLPLRNASALAHVIRHMPVKMIPGELLIGEHGNNGDYSNLVPWGLQHSAAAAESDPNLTDEEKAEVRDWAARNPFIWPAFNAPLPELQLAEAHGVLTVWGTALNHSVRAYEKVLRLGFAGLRAEVEEALAALPLTDPDAPARRATLQAWLVLCDAAMTLGTRHAARARQLAEESGDAEWLWIAGVCDRVPAHPARTFREALQALWFAHMLTVWEDGVNANSLGRVDQFLWPYLQADLAAGRLELAEATELLAALWVKLYQAYDVQQCTIGGQLPDGSDATNPLSYLALDVTEGLGFVRCLSARLHNGSPRAYVERCVDLVARGGGIPFFFNDEAIVPALADRGIPVEDARDYAPIGCIEITIPGKACPHAVSHWINLPKCLELALNDGRDLLDGAQVGPRTGTLAECSSIEDVRAACTKQLEYFAGLAVYGSNAAELAHREQFRLPYLSLLTGDCVARGLDIVEGGARYNYHSSAAMGVPDVADSLAALQQAVFTEGRVSAEELLQALQTDFADAEDLRLYLRNRLPKYGNDHPLPDDYAAELARQYCELFDRFTTPSGGRYFVHLFTFTLMIPFGKLSGASPEGRHAHEPLAYSVSPAQGRDRDGLTAMLNSLARLPHHLVAAGSSAIAEADPTLLAGPGRAAFTDLLITAISQGVGQLQFNVVNADTLRAAQQDPDRYHNLCVRVSGFSQQFGLLDREMQDHIIARTKHKS